MDIVVPCAGLSTRFPNVRPKYLLVDYTGKMMIQKIVGNLIDIHDIHIIILRDHDLAFNASKVLRNAFNNHSNLHIHIIESVTRGPAETVDLFLDKLKGESFLVRDCDSFFDFDIKEGNYVFTARLSDHKLLSGVASLGFVITNDQDIVVKLVEKRVVSDNFCVGGYQFKSKTKFRDAFKKISQREGELYISSIIDYMIERGEVFVNKSVEKYVNVGTLENWLRFNNRPTIFCDIDGVVVRNKSEYGVDNYNTEYIPLRKNIEALQRYMKDGSRIIFTTSRKQKYFDVTRDMLDSLGFRGCTLVMDINHSKRILVNDYSPTNPYPSSVAVNLKRNEDNLDEFI